MPSFSCSSSSTDESSSSGTASSSANAYPGSLDTSCPALSVPGSDESQIESVNHSPIVSSFSSHADDGYSSPHVPSEHLTSTPLASSGSVGQPVTAQSSLGQQNVTPRSRPRVENPLVRVGLVPQHLADIFLQADKTAERRPSRRITGVRVLTSNEYVQMVREKDRKEKEAAEKRRKEAREQKRVEKEQQKERKRKEREKKKHGESSRGGGKRKKRAHQSSSEDEPLDDESDLPSTSTRTRSVRAPNRYGGNSPSWSEDSDTVCFMCKQREPPIASSMVFWVDCDHCGEWGHTHCALGSNNASHQFVCESCCQK